MIPGLFFLSIIGSLAFILFGDQLPEKAQIPTWLSILFLWAFVFIISGIAPAIWLLIAFGVISAPW